MPFITSQPSCHQDVAPSVLEANAIAVTLANEWENEWNQSGLASRLSKEVGGVIIPLHQKGLVNFLMASMKLLCWTSIDSVPRLSPTCVYVVVQVYQYPCFKIYFSLFLGIVIC